MNKNNRLFWVAGFAALLFGYFYIFSGVVFLAYSVISNSYSLESVNHFEIIEIIDNHTARAMTNEIYSYTEWGFINNGWSSPQWADGALFVPITIMDIINTFWVTWVFIIVTSFTPWVMWKRSRASSEGTFPEFLGWARWVYRLVLAVGVTTILGSLTIIL